MSHPIVEKYRSLRTVNDGEQVRVLLQKLVETPTENMRKFYAASERAGRLFLMRDASIANRVIEHATDHQNETSVATLYEEHPIFESRQRLLDAREEIIAAIDHLLMSVPGSATVRDEGRGKEFRLAELGTAQLVDVLKHFSKV